MAVNTIINEDHSEIIPYNYADYNIYYGLDALSSYPNFTVPDHWHDDIEFIIPTSGSMIFNVNGNLIQLNQHEGIFVNTHQLHFIFSETQTECEFIYVVIDPKLLSISPEVEQQFIQPIISNNRFPYIHLSRNITWQNNVLNCIAEIYNCRTHDTAKLEIQSLFFKIWSEMYSHLDLKGYMPQTDSYHLSILKKMIAFIQNNFTEKISLSDIASSGGISKSNCTALFKKYMNTTPVTYLINYRLSKGAELLINTDTPITYIAYDVGFTSLSYFVEAFHKYFNCTPKMYRKNKSFK